MTLHLHLHSTSKCLHLFHNWLLARVWQHNNGLIYFLSIMCALSWHGHVAAACWCLAKNVVRCISFIEIICNCINVYESLTNLIVCDWLPSASGWQLKHDCTFACVIGSFLLLLSCYYKRNKINGSIKSTDQEFVNLGASSACWTCWWCPEIAIEYHLKRREMNKSEFFMSIDWLAPCFLKLICRE